MNLTRTRAFENTYYCVVHASLPAIAVVFFSIRYIFIGFSGITLFFVFYNLLPYPLLTAQIRRIES